MHFKYEPEIDGIAAPTTAGTFEKGPIEQAVLRAVHEGLCRALGSAILPRCATVTRALVDAITFTYSTLLFGGRLHLPSNEAHLEAYVRNFRHAELASRGRR